MFIFFFFNETATTEIYTLSLHDALPIYELSPFQPFTPMRSPIVWLTVQIIGTGSGHLNFCPYNPRKRSEEHTSELQSQFQLVCRLLLEKKKKTRSWSQKSSASIARLKTT